MVLAAGEPAAGPWRVRAVADVVSALRHDALRHDALRHDTPGHDTPGHDAPGHDGLSHDARHHGAVSPAGRPWVVAVDGRSGAGKSTLAATVAACVPGAVVVHTDDVAWHHSFFDWANLLAGGVLAPARRGEPVACRPPAWDARDRPGAIAVPAGCPLLVVEGVGAGRRELAGLVDTVVWVQSDLVEAERRGIARDGGTAEAIAFWHEWMAAELPFQAAQRPWERAAAIVSGTPRLPHDRATELVVAPGPLR
ncbi:hypothetical protein JCM9533A_68000 [Catenuloplanes niger JCM 9533]